MPETNNNTTPATPVKVVQLKDPDTKEPVSPVVNVASIFDKSGNKVDNLLSYVIAGTDVTVPDMKLIANDIREHAIRAGQTITAGDVVNVRAETEGGAETVYKDLSGETNNSSDAIALQSGVGGDTIQVGYGGYCYCEGVTEGDEIHGVNTGEVPDAVDAVAVRTNWLWIDPMHDYTLDEREEIPVPTLTTSLTYNGQAQTPAWNNYDSTKIDISGDTTGTNAGNYSTTFSVKAGYKWDDGSDAPKTIEWSIGKATPTLSLNPTSLSLVGTTPKTSTITYNGDGTLSVQSNNTGVATASLSGKTITATGVADGSTNIKVTASAGMNYNSRTVNLSVSVTVYNFATDSWAKIAQASASGIASEVYSLGDTKDIELAGIGTMTLEIADFDHDYLSASTSGDKAGISIITKDLLYQTYQMNSSTTNSGGFPMSELKNTLNGTIYNALPADLLNVIKTAYKWYGYGNGTTNGNWLGTKLWIPLEYEMFGTTTHSPASEATGAKKYPIFTDNASRIKRMNNGSSSAYWYWEASPSASDATNFCCVGSNGGATDYYANPVTICACFGLCV